MPSGVVTEFNYDAFGTLINPPSVLPTDLLYRTEPLDSVTGNQYLRARHYDPGLARFHQLDPFAGDAANPTSLHRFQYGDQDPLQNADPTGMFTASVSLGTLAIGGGRLAIEAQRVRQGGEITGAHAVRIVQFSMFLNWMVTLNEEPLIARWVVKSAQYNRALSAAMTRNLPKRTKNPTKIVSLLKAVSGEAIGRELYRRFGVPFKLTGFPNFSGHLYENSRGVSRRHSAMSMKLLGARSLDKGVAFRYMFGHFPGRFQKSWRYAWHHHEVVGIMMYVRARDNIGTTLGHAISHVGGVLYWELATNRDYEK